MKPIRFEIIEPSNHLDLKTTQLIIELQSLAFVSAERDGYKDGFVYTLYARDELQNLRDKYQGTIYLAWQDEQLAGFAFTMSNERFTQYCEECEWAPTQQVALVSYRYLEQLIVSDSFRGDGVGSSLLARVLEKEPRLITDFSVAPKANIEAKAFFVHHGFRTIGILSGLQYRGKTLSFEARAIERHSIFDNLSHGRTVFLTAFILTLFCSVIEWTGALKRLSIPSGILSGVVELSLWLFAMIAVLFNRSIRSLNLTKYLLVIALGSISFADLIYILKYYVFQQSVPSGSLSVIATSLYGLSFVAMTLFLSKMTEFTLPLVQRFVLTAVTSIGAMVIIAWLATPLFTSEEWKQLGMLTRVSELVTLFSSGVLFVFAARNLLVTHSQFWSIFSAGIVTLIAGDWSIKYQKFYSVSASYQIFESIWLLGASLISIYLIVARDFIPLVTDRLLGSRQAKLRVSAFVLFFVFATVMPPLLMLSGGAFRNWIVYVAIVPAVFVGLQIFVSDKNDLIDISLERERKLLLDEKAAKIKSEEAVVEARSQLARQVAHDIRSPLTALRLVENHLSGLSEEARTLAKSALDRIRGIAENLLERDTVASDQNAARIFVLRDEILVLVNQLISEKKSWHQASLNLRFTLVVDEVAANSGIFVDRSLFLRLISNVFDNAIEAYAVNDEVKVIRISISESPRSIYIQIDDEGKGIPEDIIATLGRRGVTHGKEGGLGLGVYFAKTTMEKWGGEFSITSKRGCGSSVKLTFTKCV